MPSKLKFLLPGICLFLFLLTDSFASEGNEKIRVCSLPLIPQTMLNDKGEPDGYAVNILQAVAKPLNWELQINYYPWLRVVSKAKKGECDIVLTVLMREDYAEFMVFPKKAILIQKNVFVVLKGSGLTFNGDLEYFMRHHSVGLYRDKAIDDRFQIIRTQPWVRIDLANNPAMNIKKLLTRRFDAVIENNLTAIYELRKLGELNKVEILNPPINATPAYITFPKKGKLSNSAAEFDKALEDFEKTDLYHQLQIQYLETTEGTREGSE